VSRVELDGVSFYYSIEQPILQDVNMRLQAGETLALVGPTGVGKSSLGLMLCGILAPSEGRVVFADRTGSRLAASTASGQVVAVLQQPERQFFLDTCTREIAFGPANLGRALSGPEVAALLDWVGLPSKRFAERDPLSLSAGEKRRLAFAAVLAMAPSLVVFDEPTAGLDAEGVRQYVQLSLGLKASGVGQLIVTHDGDLVKLLVDRVLHLKPGGRLRSVAKADFLSGKDYAGVVSSPTGADVDNSE
jgi:energy-coupling factor transporter ATP-binding protein EcfA2